MNKLLIFGVDFRADIFGFWASGAIAFLAYFLIYKMLPQHGKLSKLHACTGAEGGNRCFIYFLFLLSFLAFFRRSFMAGSEIKFIINHCSL